MVRLTERVKYDLTPVASASSGLTALDQERFWKSVRRGAENVCWPWTGSCSGGNGDWYGQFRFGARGGRSIYAHRVAWILTYGPIPAGDRKHVCHRCDVPRCCNPVHLFLGTHTDNMRDAAAKGRLHVPRPKRQKLSIDQLTAVDAMLSAGVLKTEIARMFGVSKTWVTLYSKGRRRQFDRPKATKAVA